MSRQSLFLPISLLATSVMLIVLMLTRPTTQLQATRQSQQNDVYPSGTAQAMTEQVRIMEATQTAMASRYPVPTSAATMTVTRQPTRPSGPLTPIATFPATPAAPPTLAPLPPTAAVPPTAALPQPTATARPTSTPTSTPTPTPDPNKLTCIVGQPVTINGTGPANAGLLVRFEGRIVGGGSVSGNGTYSLTMVVGVELPGIHAVTIELRDRRQVIRELTCTIPPYTITPTPAQRLLP